MTKGHFCFVLVLASQACWGVAFGGFGHSRTAIPSTRLIAPVLFPSFTKNSITPNHNGGSSSNRFNVSKCRAPMSIALNASQFASSIPILFGAVDTFYKTMPLASAFVTCGIKASAADMVAQKTQAAKEAKKVDELNGSDAMIMGEMLESEQIRVEKRRNLAFFLYGGFYQGMAQQIIFNEFFPKLFGEGTDFVTVASKVLFDSLVISPLICLPVAYLVKSVIFKYSFKDALSRYKNDVTNHGLLKKYWSLWGPVQCLTFGVVPQHLRILFIAAVSFVWLIVFSSITAKGQKERESMDDSCSLEDGVTCKIDG